MQQNPESTIPVIKREINLIIDEDALKTMAKEFLAVDENAIRAQNCEKIELLCQRFALRRMPYIEPDFRYSGYAGNFSCELEFIDIIVKAHGNTMNVAKQWATKALIQQLDTLKCGICKKSPGEYYLERTFNSFQSVDQMNLYFMKNMCMCEWIRCRPAVMLSIDKRYRQVPRELMDRENRVPWHASRNCLVVKQMFCTPVSMCINGTRIVGVRDRSFYPNFNSKIGDITKENAFRLDGVEVFLPILEDGEVVVKDEDALLYAEGIPGSWFNCGIINSIYKERLNDVRLLLRNAGVKDGIVTGQMPFKKSYDRVAIMSAQLFTFIVTECRVCKHHVFERDCNGVMGTIRPDCGNIDCVIKKNRTSMLAAMISSLLREIRLSLEAKRVVERVGRFSGPRGFKRGAAILGAILPDAMSMNVENPIEQNVDVYNRVPRASILTVDVDTHFIKILLFTILGTLAFLSACACYLCFWCRSRDRIRGRAGTLMENVVENVNERVESRSLRAVELSRGLNELLESITEEEIERPEIESEVETVSCVIEKLYYEKVDCIVDARIINNKWEATVTQAKVRRGVDGRICTVLLSDIQQWIFDLIQTGKLDKYLEERDLTRHVVWTSQGLAFSYSPVKEVISSVCLDDISIDSDWDVVHYEYIIVESEDEQNQSVSENDITVVEEEEFEVSSRTEEENKDEGINVFQDFTQFDIHNDSILETLDGLEEMLKGNGNVMNRSIVSPPIPTEDEIEINTVIEEEEVTKPRRIRSSRLGTQMGLGLIGVLFCVCTITNGANALFCGDEEDEVKNLRLEVVTSRRINMKRGETIEELKKNIADFKDKVVEYKDIIKGLRQEEQTHQIELMSCLDHLDSGSIEEVKKQIRWDKLISSPTYGSYWKLNTLGVWLVIIASFCTVMTLVSITCVYYHRKRYTEGKKNAYGAGEMAQELVENFYKKSEMPDYAEEGDLEYQV